MWQTPMAKTVETQEFPLLPEELVAALKRQDTQALENQWVEIASAPPADPAFYDQFLRAMRRAKALDHAHELLLLVLDELEAREMWPTKLQVLRLAARFWPDSKPLRPHTARALRQVYAHIPQLADMVAACKGLPLDRVHERIDEFMRMLPGEVYSHPYWGDGTVAELDIPNDRVVLEFPEADEPRREVKIDFLRKHLKHRPEGSFTAQLIRNPSQLQEFAETQPAEFVKLVLADFDGRLRQSELKELLLDRLFSEAQWNRWWPEARAALRLDPWIDFDSGRGAHATIALREQPRTVEDEVLEAYFDPAASLEQRIGAVKELARALQDGAALTPATVESIAHDLRRRAETQGAPTADRLCALYLLELLAERSPAVAPFVNGLPTEGNLLEEVQDYADLAAIPELPFALRAVRKLVERDGEEGREQAAALIPRAPLVLAQALWSVLEAEKHIVDAVRALRELFERPLENPETFYWAARQITEGRWPQLDDYVPLGPFVFELLERLNEWDVVLRRATAPPEQLQAAKWLLGKVRSLISAGDFSVIARAVADMPRDQVRDLRRVIQLHNVFNDAARHAADRCIRLVRRDLEEVEPVQNGRDSILDSRFHYTTVKGLARAVAELHELNTVTIPENAREIEKARSEGDLRENAGYHGARERHAQLLRRAAYLQEAISLARVITKDDVKTDIVSFGTRVTIHNLDTGSRETYVLLGQWESDTDKGIYYYKAPLVAQLLGHAVGEEFVVEQPTGSKVRYRVESIENALASGEWDKEPQGHA